MDVLVFISQLVDSLAWSAIVVVVVVLLRKPLSELIPFLERLKYKDLELQFSRELEIAKDEATNEIPQLPQETETTPLPDVKTQKLIEASPASAVVVAWRQIEETALIKLQQLYKSNRSKLQRLNARMATHSLMNNGLLIPPVQRLLEKLYYLRNQAVHSPSFAISRKDAEEYIVLINKVKKQIEALNELPSIKLRSLTQIVLQINHMLDSGEYNDITIDGIKAEIANGTVLSFVKSKIKEEDYDLSLSLILETYSDFEKRYCEQLQSILEVYGGDEGRKWGIESNGLCLLLAWTNEIIQLGSGWYPSE